MSIQEREYMKRDHPPFCTCVGCESRNRERNLSDADKEKLDNALRKANEKIRFRKVIYAVATTLLVGALIGALVTGRRRLYDLSRIHQSGSSGFVRRKERLPLKVLSTCHTTPPREA
jgi:hypothetical protein